MSSIHEQLEDETRTFYIVKYRILKGVKYAPGTESVRFVMSCLDGNVTDQLLTGIDISDSQVRTFDARFYSWEHAS